MKKEERTLEWLIEEAALLEAEVDRLGTEAAALERDVLRLEAHASALEAESEKPGKDKAELKELKKEIKVLVKEAKAVRKEVVRLEKEADRQEKKAISLKKEAAKMEKDREREQKIQEKEAQEEARIQAMKAYEKALYEKGLSLVAGVDEVGRGPLAGPVVAAAVILPKDFHVHGINDSKKLSEKKREELYQIILDHAVAWGIGIVDHQVIDEINILNAAKKAMTEAVSAMKIQPEHLLIDAVKLENVPISQTPIIKGDAKSLSIAAASIVAKVTRDRMMVEMEEIYPGYGFAQNKGYGTKAHYEGISRQGMSPIHRKTFLKNLFDHPEMHNEE